MSSDARMIHRQGEIITKHRETISSLEIRLAKAEAQQKADAKAAQAWRDLQKQIVSNPTVQSEWERFLMFLKMGADDEYLKENGA